MVIVILATVPFRRASRKQASGVPLLAYDWAGVDATRVIGGIRNSAATAGPGNRFAQRDARERESDVYPL
jgi:hypothetical protein